ncbi:MAG: PAS domain S-box protein [Bacteroidia bacterium]
MEQLKINDIAVDGLSVDSLGLFFSKIEGHKSLFRLINSSTGEVYCCAYNQEFSQIDLGNFNSAKAFRIVFTKTKQALKGKEGQLEISLSELNNGLLPELLLAKIKLHQQSGVKETYRTIEAHENKRAQILSKLFSFSFSSEQDLLDHALNQSIELLGSEFGYIYKYDEKTELFTLNSWSKEVMPECAVADPKTCYELDKTGFWGEAVRQRKALILNDFEAHNKLKKGYPEGHVPLKRFMTTPIYRDNKIVAVIGAANKVEPYTEKDVEDLQILMNAVWSLTQLSESQSEISKLSKAVEATDASVVITDANGNIEYANSYFYSNTGYTPDEAIGANPRVLKSGFHDRTFYKNLWDTIKSGHTWKGQLLNRKKDGSLYWENVVINPVRNLNGIITNFVAIKTDITKLKETEESVKEHDKRLDFASKLAKVHPFEIDVEKGIIYFFSDFYKIIENDRFKESITPKELEELVHPDDKEWMVKDLMNAMSNGSSLVQKYRFLINGKIKWVTVAGEAFTNHIGECDRIVGVFRDITKDEFQKRELFEKSSVIDSGLSVAKAYPWSYDIKRKKFNFHKNSNDFFREELPKEFDKEYLYRKFHLMDRQYVVDTFENSFSEDGFELEHRFLIEDNVRWVRVKGATQSEKGVPIRSVGVMQDITKEKLAEIELADSENFKSTVISSLGEGLVVQNESDQILLSNKQAAEILGLTEDQLLGKSSFDPLWKAMDENENELAGNQHPSVLARTTGQPIKDFVMNVQTGTGERKYIKINSIPLYKNSGDVGQTVTTFTDITREKVSEKELLETNRRLDFALEGTKAAMWDLDVSTGLVSIDERWATMLGYTKNEVQPVSLDTFSSFIHPDDLQKSIVAFQSFVEGTSESYNIILRLRTKLDTYLWVWSQGIAIKKDKKGRVLRMIGTNQNIDKLRKGEIALRESEAKYKALTEKLNEIIWRADENGAITFVNDYGLYRFGLSLEQLAKNGWLSIIHEEDHEKVISKWNHSIDSGSVFINEQRMKTADGSYNWFEVKATPELNERGDIVSWVGVSINRNEEIIAQKQLNKSKISLEEAQKIAKLGNWSFDILNNKVECSTEVYKLLELPEEQMLPLTDQYYRSLFVDDYDVFKKRIKVLLAGGEDFVQRVQINVNGTKKWVSIDSQKLVNETGQTEKVFGIVQDITSEVEQAQKIKESNRFLELAQEAGNAGSWKIDLESDEIVWSKRTYKMFGVQYSEVITFNKFLEYVYPDDKEKVKKAWEESLECKEYNIDHRIVVDNKLKWVNEKATFKKGKRSTEVIGMVTDITERKNLINQISNQNTKLQEIAWAQSHMVRAPLSNIMGLITLFEMVKDDAETVEQIMKNIKTTAKEFDDVIKHITKRSEALYTELNDEGADFGATSKPSIIQE